MEESSQFPTKHIAHTHTDAKVQIQPVMSGLSIPLLKLANRAAH